MTVVYQNGLPVISVRLPSRRERCQFTLKPISDSVGVFLRQLQEEDRGIDRVAIYSPGIVAPIFNSHLLHMPHPTQLSTKEYCTVRFRKHGSSCFASVEDRALSVPVALRTIQCQQMCAHRESHSKAAHIECHHKDKQAITFHVIEASCHYPRSRICFSGS